MGHDKLLPTIGICSGIIDFARYIVMWCHTVNVGLSSHLFHVANISILYLTG